MNTDMGNVTTIRIIEPKVAKISMKPGPSAKNHKNI